MSKRSLGKLFTHWALLGHEFTTNHLYSNNTNLEEQKRNPGSVGCSVNYATVTAANRFFGDRAHITYRTDKKGNVSALLHADVLFGDDTMFIKDATLRDLEDCLSSK